MTKRIEAVYKNGVLTPLEPLVGIQENGRVIVTVTTTDRQHPFDGWVGGVSDEDAAKMRNVIEEEFERIDPDE